MEPVKEVPSFDVLTRVDLKLTTSVIGDYASIRDFVSKLQNSQRTFVVDTVVFNTSDNRGDKQLRASVSLHIPYFGVPNEKK